jgi:hypothetical protein
VSQHYRRTIDELVARYALEPDLRDIFVEGPFDSDLLRWFLRRSGAKSGAVYEIETVVVPSENLVDLGLSGGMRDRVVALSELLGGPKGDACPQAICLVDADLDRQLNAVLDRKNLLYTDGSCMESYLLLPQVIDKFCQLVVSGAPHAAPELIHLISPILREAFLLRLARRRLSLGFAWQSVDRFCSRDRTSILFAPRDMTRRMLMASGDLLRLDDTLTEIDQLRSTLSNVPTEMMMNGHDFSDLLAWYLRRFANASWARSERLGRLVLSCVEPDHLSASPLFSRLLEILRG